MPESLPEAMKPVLVLRDPATLARRTDHDLSHSPGQGVTFVPFAHAVVAVLTRRDRTVLVRIEGDG